MKNDFITTILGALTGLGSYFCGLNWEIIFIWMALLAIDIITGVIKSLKDKKFNSHDMRIGLLKKGDECLLLIALILIQRVAQINSINIPVGSIFIGAFCFKELGSIIENNISMNIKLPNIIIKWFKVANETINQDQEK